VRGHHRPRHDLHLIGSSVAAGSAAAFALPCALVVKPISLALAFAIVLPAVPARAAPPRDSEQSYRELEKASGLDLSGEWAKYTRSKRSGSFAKHVDKRFRVRRNLGRGFVVAGAALVFASSYFFFFALTNPDGSDAHKGIAAGGAALGVGLLIPGGVLWGVYARRLDRLDGAIDELQLGRELAQTGGPGLRFAF
jgi:hypothetical protein